MDGDKYARRFQRTDSSMWRGILLNQKLCGLARSGIGRPRPTSAAGAPGTQHVAFFSNSQFCTQNSREFRLGHTAIFSFAHFARGFLIFNVFSRQPILTASSASGSRFPLGQNPEICPSGKDSCVSDPVRLYPSVDRLITDAVPPGLNLMTQRTHIMMRYLSIIDHIIIRLH